MRPRAGYLPDDAAFPFDGLDLMTPPTMLAPGSSPGTVNLTTFRGSLKKRSGYSFFGEAVVGGGTESILSLFSYQSSSADFLIAVTATRIFSYNLTTSGGWTEITPTPTCVKLTISLVNGWSTTAPAPSVGQFVTQASTGATGVWAGADANYYYIAVTYGIFKATGDITVSTTSGSGTVSLNGTDPGAVTQTLAQFPIDSTADQSGNAWSNPLGAFDIGSNVLQETSGATGVFYPSDASYYYISPTSGTFDDQDEITVTDVWGSGTLRFDGIVAAAADTRKVVAFPRFDGSNGWDVDSGAFVLGGSITQATSGATGTWLAGDDRYWYALVTSGTFDSTNEVSWTDSTLNVTGTGTVFLQDIIKLPKLAAGVGWAVSDGAFVVGQSVIQGTTQATGMWLTPDASYFYIQVTSGTFGDRDDISVSTVGAAGTLVRTGVTGAASTTTTTVLPTVTRALPLTGSRSDFIDHVESVDLNLGRVVVLTNGKNWPVYWDGTGKAKLLPMNLPAFCTAKCIGVLNNILVFGNVQTTTDIEPRTVAWSDTGNFRQWLTGNSGILAEINMQGELLRMLPWQGKLITFSTNSIGCICYVDSSVIFGTQTYVTGLEIISPSAICYITPFIGFAGQENVYIWDGGAQCVPIGDSIAPLYRELLDSDFSAYTTFFYDLNLQEARLVLWTSETAYRAFTFAVGVPNFRLLWRDPDAKHRDRWFETVYYNKPICFGSAQNGNELSSFMGSTDGAVEQFDDSKNDNTNAISFTWETMDFAIPQVFHSLIGRWLEVEFTASGTAVTVEWSTDGGTTWNEPTAVTLTSTLQQYRVSLDASSRTIRYRFSGNAVDSIFNLTWYRTWVRAGGPR